MHKLQLFIIIVIYDNTFSITTVFSLLKSDIRNETRIEYMYTFT